MAQHWYVNRGGKEEGPYSGAALKEMAASGALQPTDLVRRADVETARPAGQVKGLFPADGGAGVTGTPNPPAAPGTASPPHSKKRRVVVGVAVGAVLLVGLGVIGMVGSSREKQAAQKGLAEANELWATDREAAAAKLTPPVEHPDAKTLVAAATAPPSSGGPSAAAPSGEALTADYYPHTPGTRRQTLGRLFLTDTHSVQVRKEFAHGPGGAIDVRWLHQTGPSGQSLPVPKGSKLLHRLKDGFVEVGEENDGLKRTVWHPVVKVGAKVGDTWEREVVPGTTETYKLVKFGEPKMGNKEIDFDGAGPKGKVYAAFVEVRHVTALTDKKLVMTEVYELGRGVGPVYRAMFEGEGEGRDMKWWEALVKPLKK